MMKFPAFLLYALTFTRRSDELYKEFPKQKKSGKQELEVFLKKNRRKRNNKRKK